MSALIPPNFRPKPLNQFDRQLAILDDIDKAHASPSFMALLQTLRNFVNGMNRVIPCSCVIQGATLIQLTPNDATPSLTGYIDYEVFTFTASATTTGAVTLTVIPKNGALPTVKAYKNNGAVQAGAGDVVINSVYFAIFADHLDGGAGGFVLK